MTELRKMARDAGFNTEFDDYVIDHWQRFEKFARLINAAALAQPEQTRSQQMRDAGYTRRPRQLPKEDEPVAGRYDEATYRPDDLRGRQWHFTLFSTRKPYADEMVQNVTPLYTAPPQRKPLTEEEMDKLFGYETERGAVPGHLAVAFVRIVERAHGIGGEE